mgnify:CR=1 FL=1
MPPLASGVDPTPEQWRGILQAVQSRRLLPFFDSAYQARRVWGSCWTARRCAGRKAKGRSACCPSSTAPTRPVGGLGGQCRLTLGPTTGTGLPIHRRRGLLLPASPTRRRVAPLGCRALRAATWSGMPPPSACLLMRGWRCCWLRRAGRGVVARGRARPHGAASPGACPVWRARSGARSPSAMLHVSPCCVPSCVLSFDPFRPCVVQSYAKNMGLYGERVGALTGKLPQQRAQGASSGGLRQALPSCQPLPLPTSRC